MPLICTLLLLALLSGFACAEPAVKGGISPKAAYRIVPAADGAVSILDSQGKTCGSVVAAGEERTISQIECAWSPDNARAAVIVYYGSKLCELALFARQHNGLFRKLLWKEPALASYYKDGPSADTSEYVLGRWTSSLLDHLAHTDESGVLIGESYFNDDGELMHRLIQCDLQITESVVKVKTVKSTGVLRDAAAEALFARFRR